MRNPLLALAVTAERAAAELAAELTCEEVLAVQDWIRTQMAEADQWLKQNRSEIHWLVCSSETKRGTRASLQASPRKERLLYFAAQDLAHGARIARVIASVPLPEMASADRGLLGVVLCLSDAAERMPEELARPCWSEDGEWWA